PADVADPKLVGARPHGHAEGVAKPVGDDALGAGNAAVGERVVGERTAGRRVETQDGAVEADRVGDRTYVLRAQGAALRGRRLHAAADAAGRIVAGIHLRIAGLPVVDEIEARAVAGAGVQRAVRAEEQRADRVAGELLAPVLEQHLLAADHEIAGRLQARE